MKYDIAAKETTYHGIVFRSRLEASWAAFFDLLGWRWEYEPFNLNGWLPDFALVPIHRPGDLIMVEVKPSTIVDQEASAKMEKSGHPGEFLMLGIGPFERFDTPMIGHIGEWVFCDDDHNPSQIYWVEAPMGRWVGSESDEKNKAGIIGYCSESMSFRDRITGCYDGGSWGHVVTMAEIQGLWGAAKKAVRYEPR